jgi:hypothetical protein
MPVGGELTNLGELTEEDAEGDERGEAMVTIVVLLPLIVPIGCRIDDELLLPLLLLLLPYPGMFIVVGFCAKTVVGSEREDEDENEDDDDEDDDDDD